MKKNACSSINDSDRTEPDEEGSAIPRVKIDGDYLFITFTKAHKESQNSRGEYQIHSLFNNEIVKVLLQQPLISRMWILEFANTNPQGMISFFEVEKIQRCRGASAPEKLIVAFKLKGGGWYFECGALAPDEHLEPVYTLAQFS